MSVQRGTPGFNPKVQPGGQPPCPTTASRINPVPSTPLLGLGWWERAHGAEGKLRHGTAGLSGGAGTAPGHPSPAAGPGPDLPIALLGCSRLWQAWSSVSSLLQSWDATRAWLFLASAWHFQRVPERVSLAPSHIPVGRARWILCRVLLPAASKSPSPGLYSFNERKVSQSCWLWRRVMN